MNQKFDKTERVKNDEKDKKVRELKQALFEQVAEKKEKNLQKLATDRAQPDIEGDMGYPPRPQPTKEEDRQNTLRNYAKMDEDLKQQIKNNQKRQKFLDSIESHYDRDYLEVLYKADE